MAAAAPVEEPRKCYRQKDTKNYGVIMGQIIRPPAAAAAAGGPSVGQFLPPSLSALFAGLGGGNPNHDADLVEFHFKTRGGNGEARVREVKFTDLEEVNSNQCEPSMLVGGYRRRRRTHRKRHTRRRGTRARKH